MKKISVQTMTRQFKRSFSEERLNALGKQVRFCRRERCITPRRLALSMIEAFGGTRLKSIADIQRTFNSVTQCDVQYKPFHNQLAKPEFPMFMQELLTSLMNDLSVEVLKFSSKSPFTRFQRLRLQDGTSFALKSTLAKEYPGRFTTISPAAVELHVELDLFSEAVQTVMLSPDSTAEGGFLPDPTTLKGDLLLADRGYFDKQYCLQVDQAQGHFIVRGKANHNPLILAAHRAQGGLIKCWQGKRLKEVIHKLPRHHLVDLDVQFETRLGTFNCRLIASSLLRKDSPVYLVTNLPRDRFSPEQVGDGYRLRWQIELLFKEWKSFFNLHAFDTSNENIATGLIWAALCAAVLSRYCAHMTERITATAMSTHRVAMCLPHLLMHLIKAILHVPRTLTNVLRHITAYLANNARRAHPHRDKMKGRLKLNLRHVYARA